MQSPHRLPVSQPVCTSRGTIVVIAHWLPFEYMHHELAHLDYFELHALLIDKNKEFTNGIKAGKKHTELQSLYDSIQQVYTELRSRKIQPIELAG